MVGNWLLLGVFVMGIIGVVFGTARLKVHPFLALFFTALAMGLASGISPSRVADLVVEGFSGILGYIAIIVVSATIIGELLDKTGATLVLSDTILRFVGRSRSPLAMGLAGYLVSVPVMCCDTGFIILSPLARALSSGSGFSVAVFSLSLAAGAFTSFKLIYPAAPLFPAAIFGADIAGTIILGAVASIPVFVISMIWAYHLGRRYRETPAKAPIDVPTSYDELGEKFGKLPSPWASFGSLMLPIILIVVRSILNGMLEEANALRTTFDFLGNPVIALPIGVGLALILARDKPLQEVNGWISNGISRSASILVIVGAGGVLGKILQETGIGTFLGNSVLGLGIPALVVVFLISALIKTGQGSSMVTMVTAPAIIYPVLPALGLDPVLATMAVCAGAMVCVNVNDSFFWVVTGFSGMDMASGFKTLTAMSIVMGLVALVVIAVAGPLIIDLLTL